MYIVAIAWLYVALMMAVAEATNSNGTLLGAVFTFLLYGLGPVALVLYLLGTPARRRRLKAREAQADREAAGAAPAPDAAGTLAEGTGAGQPAAPAGTQPSLEPDAGRHAAADTPVATVRKEP